MTHHHIHSRKRLHRIVKTGSSLWKYFNGEGIFMKVPMKVDNVTTLRRSLLLQVWNILILKEDEEWLEKVNVYSIAYVLTITCVNDQARITLCWILLGVLSSISSFVPLVWSRMDMDIFPNCPKILVPPHAPAHSDWDNLDTDTDNDGKGSAWFCAAGRTASKKAVEENDHYFYLRSHCQLDLVVRVSGKF